MIRGQVTAVACSCVLAVLAGLAHPVLAFVPLVLLGLPAALMLAATVRHGSPYDVRHRYRPGSVGPHN